MNFKFKHLQKIVGGFFILTVIIVFVMLIIVARGQRWFQSYIPYVTYFESSGGLRSGSLVLIRDIEAGRVESVFLDEDNRVRVNFKLFGQYADRMREGTTARVLRPVVGTTALVLMLGPGTGELIPKGGLLPSTGDGAVAGLDALIEEAIRLVGDLQNPKGDLMQTLANVNVATSSLARSMTTGNSSLRMLLEKRDLYDQLISATKHMDGLLSALNESTPDIQDAIIEARRGLEEVNRVVLALQKSIFLRGNIENYLKEDSTLIYEARP